MLPSERLPMGALDLPDINSGGQGAHGCLHFGGCRCNLSTEPHSVCTGSRRGWEAAPAWSSRDLAGGSAAASKALAGSAWARLPCVPTGPMGTAVTSSVLAPDTALHCTVISGSASEEAQTDWGRAAPQRGGQCPSPGPSGSSPAAPPSVPSVQPGWDPRTSLPSDLRFDLASRRDRVGHLGSCCWLSPQARSLFPQLQKRENEPASTALTEGGTQ